MKDWQREGARNLSRNLSSPRLCLWLRCPFPSVLVYWYRQRNARCIELVIDRQKPSRLKLSSLPAYRNWKCSHQCIIVLDCWQIQVPGGSIASLGCERNLGKGAGDFDEAVIEGYLRP